MSTETQSVGARRPPGADDGQMRRTFDEMNVGDTFASRSRTVTETDVVQFAALTADWHPVHTDQVYAEESFVGQRIAQGMLVVAYAIGLVPNTHAVALRRLKSVVFKRPVYLGDTIRVEGKVADKRPMSDELGLVTGRWSVVNQDDQTVVKLELEALWRREA